MLVDRTELPKRTPPRGFCQLGFWAVYTLARTRLLWPVLSSPLPHQPQYTTIQYSTPTYVTIVTTGKHQRWAIAPPGIRNCPTHRPDSSPHTAMDLPQELLDEIFSHLPSDGVELLRGCSLVSKSWLEPSRRILFAEISIPSDKYQSWLDCISPENTAILRHVRSLKFFPSNTMAPDSSYGVYTLRNYFPSLCQLQSLSLHNIDVEPTISRDPDLFSPFQHTLSSLSLVTVSITWSALVALLRCFPLLRNLEIHEILFLVDNEQSISPLPNTLRGRLVLGPLQGVRPFVDHFPDMKQEYEELVLFGVPEPCIVAAVQENLKYLTIHRCECTSLSHIDMEPRDELTKRHFVSGSHGGPFPLFKTPQSRNRHDRPTGTRADSHLIHNLHGASKTHLHRVV